MGVGAAVVQHHMQLPPRVGLDHQLEEGEELGVAVPWEALVGNAAISLLQRREQGRRPVPGEVVGPPLRAAQAQRQVGAVRESAWIWRGLSREGLRQASSLG
jgi:hypothetical protein